MSYLNPFLGTIYYSSVSIIKENLIIIKSRKAKKFVTKFVTYVDSVVNWLKLGV